MTGHVVQTPPRRATEVGTPPGHNVFWQECFTCHRDFRVYVPGSPQSFAMVVQDVPCPHCHRFRAEVRVEHSELPILVEPTQRSWLAWRLRRLAQLIHVARRTLSIRLSQALREVSRWFAGSPKAR
jgi:hypothetical protein